MQVFVRSEVLAAVERVTDRLASLVAGSLIETQSGLRTNIQAVCELKHGSTLDSACHDLVVTHAILAERMCPGTFRDCIQNIRALVVGESSSTGRKRFGGSLSGRRANLDDIRNVIIAAAGDRPAWVVKMIEDALETAGFAGKILVEKVNGSCASLELVSGYSFAATSHLKVSETLQHPKVCVIDGFIESVSEIHHLLEASSSRKQPVVLVARNFAADVKHTLSVNYARGTLKVLPYTVAFDLEGANVLVDISIAAGCDLISSLKGDLISSVRLEALPTVDYVTAYADKFIINNNTTSKAVALQVKKLRDRRLTEHVEQVTNVLDARVRSLIPSQVVVRLPNDAAYVLNAQAFDRSLRAVKSAIDHGVIDDERGTHLALSKVATMMYATKAAEVLADLGAVVTP